LVNRTGGENMLYNWFKSDIKKLFQNSDRVVLIDKEKEYDFLVDELENEQDIKILIVDDFVSDLLVKYKIEKEIEGKKVLIHSYIVPSDKDERQYMIQEYAATGDFFKHKLDRYIAEKASLLDSRHRLTANDIILAGKVSMKDEYASFDYWENIKNHGKKAILGKFDDIILDFLCDYDTYLKKLPTGGKELLYELIGEYIGRIPDIDTEPKVIIKEFTNKIFDNILYKKNETYSIYRKWLNSVKHRDRLKSFLDNYQVAKDVNAWSINPDHPFKDIDYSCLEDIAKQILNKEEISKEYIDFIKIRIQKKEGMDIAGSNYWEAIYELIKFNGKESHKIEDITDFVESYKSELYKLDKAFRIISEKLLNNKEVKKAFYLLYREKSVPYLKKWFDLFSNYRENQTDFLFREIFSKSEDKAVIIGDALSYEVSQEIVKKIKKYEMEVSNRIISGNYPSTTINNMSALFGSPISNKRKEREKSLNERLKKNLQVFNLDEIEFNKLDVNLPSVIYGQDIDSISEKNHESALKYYSVFIETVVEKIKLLLDAGYSEVHLTTDHGFVLNFEIDESDKYISPVEGNIKDRYILSNEKKESIDNYVIKENNTEGYSYAYYPKGIDPIKSTQKYGFSHGGISPQELLLPHIIFKKKSINELKVYISNKSKLKHIASNNFKIEVEAEKTDQIEFNTKSRDVIIKIENNKEIVSEEEFTINNGETKHFSRSIQLDNYTIMIQDNDSKEILDSVIGKKEELRGGIDEFDID
jgi:hypothetical protein